MDGSNELRGWLEAGARAVRSARDRLDAINVFPVADSDTGTNIYLTLQEGNRAVAKLPETATHREVVAAFARGALMGARGNSGVIVSQYLSALLTEIDRHGGLAKVPAIGLADALDSAADAAYSSVGTPVEGTILTVARAAAAGAKSAASQGARREAVSVEAVLAARTALATTHDQLPAAREAGVVDAGAAGLVLQLEMLAETLAGPGALDALDEVEWELTDRARRHVGVVAQDDGGGAYEVMFVVGSREDLRERLTGELSALGGSVAVTGSHRVWTAHVHTDRVADALALAFELDAPQALVRPVALAHMPAPGGIGLVALTAAPGLAEALASAGASIVVAPDPARVRPRPIKRVMREASESLTIVLAGDPELRGAAGHAATKRGVGNVIVTSAWHEAQLVAGLAAATLATPGEDMERAIEDAVSQMWVGSSTADALDDDLDRNVDETAEVVTLIIGRGVPSAVVDSAVSSVRASHPVVDVNVYRGEQAHPPILIGIERSR